MMQFQTLRHRLKTLWNLSKPYLPPAIIVALTLFIIIFTVFTLENKKKLGYFISLAGRQEVLSEKHQKEILLESEGHKTDYLQTRRQYLQTINILFKGGSEITEPIAYSFSIRKLKPVPSNELAVLISENLYLFRTIIEKSDRFLLMKPTDPGYNELKQEILNLHDELISTDRRILELLVAYSLSKNRQLAIFLIIAGFLITLLAAYMGRLIRRRNLLNRKLISEINERKNIQEELDRFFSLSVDILCIMSIEGKFKKFNNALPRVLGFNGQELINKSIFDILHPADVHKMRSHIDDLKQGKSLTNIEIRAGMKNGGYKWFSWTAVPDLSAGKVYSVARDVTEMKKANEELKQSRMKMRSIVNSIPDIIMQVDHDGYIIDFKPPKGENSIFARKQFVNHSLRETYFQAVSNKIQSLISKALDENSKEIYQFEFSLPSQNGRDETFYEARILKFTQHDALVIIRDVSIRKKAEQALIESQQRYSELFQKSNDGIYLHDEKGNMLDVNNTLLKLLGYTKEEFLELNIIDLVPDDLKEEAYRAFDKIEKERSLRIEFPLKRKDGSKIPTEISANYIQIGNKTYVQGIVRDISERKKVEQALKESEEKYRNIVQLSQEGIWVMDKNNHTILVNKRLVEMLGTSEDEIMHTTLFDWIEKDEEYCEELKQIYEKKPGVTVQCDIRLKRKDKKTLWALINIESFADNHGRYNGAMAMLSDVTERKKYEEELRNNEDRMRQLLNAMPIGVFIIDNKGKPYYANKRAEELLGKGIIPDTDATALPVVYKAYKAGTNQYYPPEEMPIYRALKGETSYVDDMIIKQNGKSILLEVWGKPVYNQHGEIIFAIAAFNDITERKKAEKKLKELIKEIEAANKELSDFAYVVSHDLKAPLRGISTLASWLEEDYADKLDDEGKEHIALIQSRVKRLNNLINGILQYSRIGRKKEEKTNVDLNKLLNQIIDLLVPKEKFRVFISDKLPTIYAEPTRIEQVFSNLISNAVKYMDKPEGVIEIGYKEQGDHWLFWVKDNGPGIDKKYHAKIFQMFQTLNARNDMGSTGIGLALVKKIIESYHGKIWLKSTPGKGTTFYFTLPKTLKP